MPRENEFYRDNLEALRTHFGANKNVLTIKDVADYCGLCPQTARTRFEIGIHGISLPTLARKLSQM